MALTVKKTQRLLRKGEPGRFLDGVKGGGVRGLYLAVDGKTAASWRCATSWMATRIGTGSVRARTFWFEPARQRAKKARQRLADGIDPIQTKRADRATKLPASTAVKTFRECAEDLIEAPSDKWKSADHGSAVAPTLQPIRLPQHRRVRRGQVDRPAYSRCSSSACRPRVAARPGKFWIVRTMTADRVRNRVELALICDRTRISTSR